ATASRKLASTHFVPARGRWQRPSRELPHAYWAEDRRSHTSIRSRPRTTVGLAFCSRGGIRRNAMSRPTLREWMTRVSPLSTPHFLLVGPRRIADRIGLLE